MAKRVVLMVGTRKGAFIFESDEGRRTWRTRGPFAETWPIHDMTYDAGTGSIYAAGGSPWYGASVWRSDDLGETWSQSSDGLAYADGEDKVRTVWNVTPVHGSLYAGVEPAGLFRSDDRGATWQHVSGLRDHPTRAEWQPGQGGLCLHSIVGDPADASHLWVGISAVGTFETRDGGASWEPRNRGVRADFYPDPHPVIGQCVHKLIKPPSDARMLYQQNHCGVYRSGDDGANWEDITPGLPSQFGFPMVAHPHDARTLYTIPLNGDDRGRYMPEGRAAVWRTPDGGDSWTRLDRGLPSEHAYLGVLREAMGTDTLDEPGVYFGTSTGELFASADAGDSWSLISAYLPGVWSVKAAVIDA